MAKKNKAVDYEKQLTQEHERWSYIKEHGAQDPFWADGVNLNLVRNHILYYRKEVEAHCTLEKYPSAYFREIPPEVDSNYIVRPDEIRANAKLMMEKYASDPNLQYLKSKVNSMNEKRIKESGIVNLICYEKGLKEAIATDDLITMRRYEHNAYCFQAFAECAVKIRAYKPEANEQISLFEFIEDDETMGLNL